RPLGPRAQGIVLPIFAVPVLDRRQGNELLALFVELEGPRASLTAVWTDEDIQIPLLDALYDWHRWGKWHRVADVESFSYAFPSAPGGGRATPSEIIFPGAYSAQQTWDVLPAEHQVAHLPAEDFLWLDGRPVIFVNTWNHLLSNENNNPHLALEFVADYPVYAGSRAEVQKLYEAVYPD
ncbi:MAG: hypothetical protein QF599_11830, partial [Planctomycetota bacterium]|nr:hypothetical protein [Planctomycetota bacterium]